MRGPLSMIMSVVMFVVPYVFCGTGPCDCSAPTGVGVQDAAADDGPGACGTAQAAPDVASRDRGATFRRVALMALVVVLPVVVTVVLDLILGPE